MFVKDKDLTSLTTFGIPTKAALFAEYDSPARLLRISRSREFIENEVLHIGGGSNLLFVNDFNGLVLHSAIKGITKYEKDPDNIFVIAGAGEKWTDLVDWCIDNNLAGLENLAGIPGEVGASPVQNVGAYGVEAKDYIYSVECFDSLTRQTVTFKNEDCGFAYRDSRFKNEWKGRYYVLRVSFRLTPSDKARHLDYGPLRNLSGRLGHEPTLREVADEIIAIRDSKLPDPKQFGSAGSFFKNPVVGRYFYEQQILGIDPDVPHYEVDEHHVKVPAGWLIEHSGLKEARIGGAFVWPKQCLVIANSGNASASDVADLAELIRNTVRSKTGISLQPEVNYIDTTIKVTVLGSGTSKGVPEARCSCEICRSPFAKDKRLRASVLVQAHGLNLLIDVSPDFREQALRNDITDLDAVLITHSHYDHVGGFDDLRPYCDNDSFPVYLKKDVNEDLHRRIDYCFREHPYPGVPTFDMHEVSAENSFYIKGVKIIPIAVNHGNIPILGYRIGDFAYITDAKTIPETEMWKLEGVKVMILNALRPKTHFAHMSFSEAIEFIHEVNPEEAYLTHFNHEAGFHHDLEHRFGPHIHPAYDGMTIII